MVYVVFGLLGAVVRISMLSLGGVRLDRSSLLRQCCLAMFVWCKVAGGLAFFGVFGTSFVFCVMGLRSLLFVMFEFCIYALLLEFAPYVLLFLLVVCCLGGGVLSCDTSMRCCQSEVPLFQTVRLHVAPAFPHRIRNSPFDPFTGQALLSISYGHAYDGLC